MNSGFKQELTEEEKRRLCAFFLLLHEIKKRRDKIAAAENIKPIPNEQPEDTSQSHCVKDCLSVENDLLLKPPVDTKKSNHEIIE